MKKGRREKLGDRRRAIPHNAQVVLTRSYYFHCGRKMRDGLKPGSLGKRKQRRHDNQCCMQRAICVGLKIAAPRQVLCLGRRSAGLQIVCQRNDRKQNHDQYGQCHNLHTGGGAQRCICPSTLAPEP